VVIVSCWLPEAYPVAAAPIDGVPVAVDPYQNVAALCPLGMVTLVIGVDANCVVPNTEPGPLVRSTVRGLPEMIGAPTAFWSRTVIGPRLGVLDVAPDTGGELKTTVPIPMVSMNCWVAPGPMPFRALMQTAYVPPAPAPGVPDSKPLLENVIPGGNGEGRQPWNAALENVGAGLPDAATWKVPALPTWKFAELALVMAGELVSAPLRTFSVKFWVAVLVAPPAVRHTA
jgi:hypothetical protein